MYNPTIVAGRNNRLIIGFEISGPETSDLVNKIGSGKNRIYVSDDDGASWQYRTNFEMMQERLFAADGVIYLIGHVGHRGDLLIIQSRDNGDTWSAPVQLTTGQLWHSSAHNVIRKGRYVYMVMERNDVNEMKKTWDVSEMTPALMRGDISRGLMSPEAWTFADPLPFCQAVEDKDMEYFGVPFFDAYYPKKTLLKPHCGFPPVGWLESNVVQISDPKHYWYDPNGKTFHIFSRAHTGRTNLAAMLKAVEQPDGTIKTMLETAPSGKKLVYVPLPGGQMKFYVLYDETSKMYWLLSTQSTDSMTRVEMLPEGRYGAPDNERRRLQLHFSRNMVDWCFAGMVAIGPSEKSSRHYASMEIDDDDLVILSRSGDLNARDAHNGNIITFHRVKNFRNLIY